MSARGRCSLRGHPGRACPWGLCRAGAPAAGDDAGDYYTINLSCPNVHGGECFAETERLRILLDELGRIRHDRPLYAKLPIIVSWIELDGLLQLLDGAHFHGVVIGNLNKDYDALTVPSEAPDEFESASVDGHTRSCRPNWCG